MSATLKQGKKVLSVFEDMSADQMQAMIESGILADIRDCDISKIDRDKVRECFGLPSLTPKPEPILKLISAGHDLILGACDGTKIIAKAKKTFPSGIDSDFVRWRADEPGQPTSATVPDVYEMDRDATFSQMFGFLGANIADVESMRKRCFTQHQIIDFVEKYPNWLRTDGYGTFFLLQSHGQFFVAYVSVDSGGLGVRVSRFGYSRVWYAVSRRRVVVPQLA